MEFKAFDCKVENKVATLALDRPSKANSLDIAAWEEMQSAFEYLDTRSDVRVVILKGNGEHFCAGMDLSALMSLQSEDEKCDARKRDNIRKFILKIQDTINAIERCSVPVIAAIHGGCIGGGVDIVTACDMRFATDDAYFTIKEVDLGIVADLGTLQRLPTIIHPGIVAELAFTGRKFSGLEAQEIFFVNKSFKSSETLYSYVDQIATNIASKSPLVIRGIKEMLLYKRDHSVRDSLDYMASYNAAMLLSDDLQESFMAYTAKRQPQYKDLIK